MRRGLVWPLLLITLGVVFLLANFGVIAPFSFLAVVSLWPLLLILIGVDIVVGQRSPAGALLVEVLIIAAGLALVAAQPVYPQLFPFGNRASLGPTDSKVSVPRGTAQSMTFHLNGGAGTFHLSGGGTDLVSATSDQNNLTLRASGSAERPDVRIDETNRGIGFGRTVPVSVDVKLASDVATSLELDAGAGEFVLDLRDVKVTDARLDVGAASLRIVLPKPSGDVSITISAGASSVVVEVPEGVEARVNTKGALMSVRSENPRIRDIDTSGYGTAKDRVTVTITAGASSVVIR
jgi:hypothetical protein